MSFLYSIANIVFGLVYTQFLIKAYGSSVNGLISTLTQFVSLFSIIEGGFTTAAIVATYKPIVDKDYKKLNDILLTAKTYFNRIGIIITVLVLLCGSVYVRFINSPFSYFQTFSLLIVSVLNIALSLCGLSKYNILLEGQNRRYILVAFSLLARLVTWTVSIILIVTKQNIVLVYLMNIANVLLNIILTRKYENKHYKYVTYKGEYDRTLIKGTGDVLFQKIANTIFTSTDLIIISVLINLESSSVYNLYYLIFKAVSVVLSTATLAPFNSFGQLVNSEKDKERINSLFDVFQQFACIISSILLTSTGVLIVPFVKIYSKNIIDFNYVRPLLAMLFFSQMYAQTMNAPCGTILNASGNFHMQNKQCCVAAIVNIICSLAFIKWWGVNSVVLGSVIGTSIIFIANIIQAYKNVLQQSSLRTVFTIIGNYLLGLGIISISQAVIPSEITIIEWLILACASVFGFSIIFLLFNVLISKDSTIKTIVYIKNAILSKRSSL